MQDRFKFRTYDKRTKEMLNVRLILYFNTGNICRVEAENAVGDIIIFDDYKTSIEDIELMQCTGLKDKNGKLIFELDHIKYKKETYKVGVNKFLGITLTNILNGDIIIMDNLILFNCEVISNEFECNTKI